MAIRPSVSAKIKTPVITEMGVSNFTHPLFIALIAALLIGYFYMKGKNLDHDSIALS